MKLQDKLAARDFGQLSAEELAAAALFRAPMTKNVDDCRLGIAKAGSLVAYIENNKRLAASRELISRSLTERSAGREKVQSVNDAKLLLSIRLGHLEHEVFASIFLDKQHRIIAYRELFRGSVHGARVHVREIVREAVKANAATVVLAHNHPSGEVEPSEDDLLTTADIITALDLIEVEVLDHIIVGKGAVFSFRENELIE